jgi:serine-type D-Ala-D-Ala carboxypeptidase/endopeptidase
MKSLIALVMSAASASVVVLAMVPDDEIRRILVERIDVRKQAVGIVVGMLGPEGRHVVSYGKLAAGDARPLDGDTVFEIGSVTKVFTSLLLADMVQRGEVSLDDPVSKYLPPDVRMPRRGGRDITLVDLATHTSGLPRLPTPFTPKDPTNPYADYTVDDLYRFLSGYELRRDIGAQYEYSNLGGGLLGHVLSRRAGTDYESLVRARITGPLGMNDTRVALTPEMRARLAVGHNDTLTPVPNWDLPTLAGAGALRSTVNDMLKFVAVPTGDGSAPLASAMASMLAVRRPAGNPALDIALGWHVAKRSGREIVWHNGGTGGYRSMVAFDPKAHTAVVVLSNTFTASGVDDIGLHLIDPTAPLIPAPLSHTEITLEPNVLQRYVGRYQLAPGFVIEITRTDNHLFEQATNQPRFEIFAEKENGFFLKVVDAQITFESDASGHVTGLVLHQGGQTIPGKRVE